MSEPVPGVIATRRRALEFLDARIGTGVKPGLDRIAGLLALMGDPHTAYPVIHVAGTNGKTTVVRMIADLLGAHGLTAGAFTSPHLQRVEERFAISGRPLDEPAFVQAAADLAPFVEAFERQAGESTTYFEITAALAFGAFASAAVDVGVVEVGLGGRWDATNVVAADVSVITGLSLDHMAWLGHSIPEIAGEKAAILKQGGLLVTGPLPAEAEGVITGRVAETGSRWIRSESDYRVIDLDLAFGGWSLAIEGVYERYDDLYLALHGRHQVTNFATAVAAVESFFGRPLDPEAVRRAAAVVSSPGRLEVVGRRPLVLLDGAHNEEALTALATALIEEFPPARWELVVGMRGDRDPQRLLEPLRGLVARAWATAPDDPAAIGVSEVAAGAREALAVDAVEVGDVANAVDRAIEAADEDGFVLVTGSLYVVGEARTHLVPPGTPTSDEAAFVRIEAEVEDD